MPCSSVSRATPYQRICRSDSVRRELVSDGLRSLVTGRNTGRGDKTGLDMAPAEQKERSIATLIGLYEGLTRRVPVLAILEDAEDIVSRRSSAMCQSTPAGSQT